MKQLSEEITAVYSRGRIKKKQNWIVEDNIVFLNRHSSRISLKVKSSIYLFKKQTTATTKQTRKYKA